MLLVIDIGGTAIKYACCDLEGTVDQHGELPTNIKDYEGFLQTITTLYEGMSDMEGIAISMPGLLHSEEGYVVTGGALPFNAGQYVASDLMERCHVHVSIQNDGKCAALAELWKGSLKDHSHGIVFVIGTGIGGGIVIDHKLYTGANAFAGELSFLLHGECSMEHCLGATGSVHSMLLPYQKLTGSSVDGRGFFAAVHAGDERAIDILHDYAKRMALQFFNLQAMYDPEVIAIGGGISAQDILLTTLQEALEQLYQQIPFAIPHAKLVRCTYGNHANLVGAIYQYRKLYAIS